MHRGRRFVWTHAGLGVACAAAALACREGSETNVSAAFIPIVPAAAGAHGCNGPNQTFAAPVTVYGDPALGPMSQIAAARGAETVFFTGADESIRALDFSGGGPPVETVLVTGGAGGAIEQLLQSVGIAAPGEISGIAVLDAANLIVVEHASNTILLASRINLDSVSFLVGFPSTIPGFANGFGSQVRFSFPSGIPTQIVPTGDGRIFVADSGNHALREITIGPLSAVVTAAGTGSPFHADGNLTTAGFDTPVGLSVSCGGQLLVTEVGSSGLGGHRLRSLSLGTPNFLGANQGSVMTLAGNGTQASVQGIGTAASLAAPRGPVSTSAGEIYWIDSSTGILRRYALASGLSDCPLFPDCASASATFAPGPGVSLAVTDSGALYALDGNAGVLVRLVP